MNDTASEARYDVVVVGAGAAGLMAAAEAGLRGRRTLLLEKNRKPGVKILMSGGTRCNITQSTDNRGIVAAFGPQGRFLHGPLANFGVAEALELFHAEGVPTKVESTGKIFPASDKATDVLAALVRRQQRSGAALALQEPLTEVERTASGFRLTTPLRSLETEKLLITTGGVSYPGCGTTGDGYAWAAQLGHTIVSPQPALVPIVVTAPWVRTLAGITIVDTRLRVLEPADLPTSAAGTKSCKPRVLAERRGSLLFAHFGLTGPVAMDVSRAISGHANQSLVLECDFLPQVAEEQLFEKLREQAQAAGKKQLATAWGDLLPRRLADALAIGVGLSPETKLAEVSQRFLRELAAACKQARLAVQGTLGFAKAEVTAGGVALDEIHSSSMQSKLVPNLYLAGEVIDIDGPIGGYNFQAAWSTGTLAGRSM